MIEARRIHQAVTLSKHRNFARAAAVLGMTQPALTRSIQVLEEELGVRLFDRLPRDVVPTEYGRLLLDRGEPILGAIRELQAQIDRLRGLEAGLLAVGVGPALTGWLLGPALSRFAAAHPRVPVQLVEDQVSELMRALRAREIELFLAYVGDEEPEPGLEVERLGARRALFYARSDHPLARRRKVALESILEFPVAGPRLPRRLIDRVYRGSGISSAARRLPTVACRTFEAARAMVLAGPVIGYAPFPLVAAGLRSGQLSEIRYPLERLPGGAAILTLRGRTPSAAAAALIAELRSVDGSVTAT